MTATFDGASPATVPGLFVSDWASADGRTVVSVRGELDIATAEQLIRSMRCHVRRGARIVMNLSGLAFCDCRGLSALSRVADLADTVGCQIVLAAPRPIVVKLLRLSRMDQRLPVAADVMIAHR
jgi:anti-anti-sigma factor